MLWLRHLITNSSLLTLSQSKSQIQYEKTSNIDYNTIATLANISYDVYYLPNNTKWKDPELNKTVDISTDRDQVNAYIFSNEQNTEHVIAFKGTSVYWQTALSSVYNDKFNDNLYFSCCYYEESSIFSKNDCVCTREAEQCPQKPPKTKTCYSTCYKNSTNYPLNYYKLAQEIMKKASKVIDLQDSNIIFTGHSLGGVLATMMGLLYKKMVVTFEAPGEKHYIQKAGVQYDQESANNIYHFGHNADIIFTGKCNGITSWCYLGGYIIETKCHIGNVCEYDTKGILGIKESIYTHKMEFVIENVITKWNNTIPSCEKPECTDCDNWTFI
jgi:lipase ATG15